MKQKKGGIGHINIGHIKERRRSTEGSRNEVREGKNAV